MARRNRLGKGVMAMALPPVVGAGVAALSTLGIRAAIAPTDMGTMKVYRFAPLIGAALGAVVGGVSMGLMGGKGKGAVAAVLAGLTGLAFFVGERLNASKPGAAVALAPAAALPTDAAGVAGLSAIVAEYQRRGMQGLPSGMGTILMEPTRGTAGVGAMGETVNLRGIVNTDAFGKGLTN